jgi:hypothetical protein
MLIGGPVTLMAFRLLPQAVVRYLLAAVLALSSVACGSQNGTVNSVLPSPTVLIQTANAVCETQITALNFDVDYSGPHLVIDISFASAPAPVEIEIERYLADGRTEPFTTVSKIVGTARIPLNFNTKYRGRARVGSCPWSPWVDQQIGPPNSCGDCTATPPPPPPPPPPDDDDECVQQQALSWEYRLRQLQVHRMEGPPPPPPDPCVER